MKLRVERGLTGPLHELASARVLDNLEDRGRGAAERVSQLLIAVALKLGPDAQSAFVRADPRSELDALGSEEAALELTVVRNVIVGAPEAVDDVTKQGRVG
jgi:hypothetical protein